MDVEGHGWLALFVKPHWQDVERSATGFPVDLVHLLEVGDGYFADDVLRHGAILLNEGDHEPVVFDRWVRCGKLLGRCRFERRSPSRAVLLVPTVMEPRRLRSVGLRLVFLVVLDSRLIFEIRKGVILLLRGVI